MTETIFPTETQDLAASQQQTDLGIALRESLGKLEKLLEGYLKKIENLTEDKRLLLEKVKSLSQEHQALQQRFATLQQAHEALAKTNESVLGDLSGSIENLEKLLAPHSS